MTSPSARILAHDECAVCHRFARATDLSHFIRQWAISRRRKPRQPDDAWHSHRHLTITLTSWNR